MEDLSYNVRARFFTNVIFDKNVVYKDSFIFYTTIKRNISFKKIYLLKLKSNSYKYPLSRFMKNKKGTLSSTNRCKFYKENNSNKVHSLYGTYNKSVSAKSKIDRYNSFQFSDMHHKKGTYY